MHFEKTVFDFKMATKSPILTHSLKITSKTVLKKTGLHIFDFSTWHKQKLRIKNVRVNHVRQNLLLGVEKSC